MGPGGWSGPWALGPLELGSWAGSFMADGDFLTTAVMGVISGWELGIFGWSLLRNHCCWNGCVLLDLRHVAVVVGWESILCSLCVSAFGKIYELCRLIPFRSHNQPVFWVPIPVIGLYFNYI
jgi:hypothetical protein